MSLTEAQPAPSEPNLSADPFRQFLHTTFVTYNPIYLASAALVLAGLWLVSRDLAVRGGLYGLGVSGIADLYAIALIGSAAILFRTGQRRAAVMLGLLAAVYQGDVTLHVETSSFMGRVGVVAAIGWVLLFGAKLVGLEAALALRLSRSAFLVPMAGACALALLPQAFPSLSPDARGSLVALAVFAVGAAAAWTAREVFATGFDLRGRRAVRGVWILWAVLAMAHVAYWCAELGVRVAPLLPVFLLLATRGVARERTVWLLVLASLMIGAAIGPGTLAITGWMAAATLALHAFRTPVQDRDAMTSTPPYRGDAPELISMPTRFEPAPAATGERYLLGAAASLHASLIVLGSGRLMGEHVWLIDGLFVALSVVFFVRMRRPIVFAPLVPGALHLCVQSGLHRALLGSPSRWGVTAIAAGFGLLLLGVVRSVLQHRRIGAQG